MTKRILYTGNFLFPEDGAAAKRVLNIARAAKQNGNEIFFFGNNEHGRDKDHITNSIFKYEDFYYFSYIKRKSLLGKIDGYNSFPRIKKMIKYIEENFGKIDIVIGYHMDSLGMINCIKYCNKNSIDFISDCTEWYDPVQISKGKYSLGYINSQIRMKYVNKKAKKIICISEYLENYYRSSVKTTLIPSLEKFSTKEYVVKKIKENDTIQFIYCGSPGKKDDLLTIIQSFNLVQSNKKWILKIVGISEDEFYLNQKNYVLEKKPNIIFVGKVPYEEAKELVEKSTFSLLIRPENKRYTKAGFPSKVPESMSLGTPMICNYTSDLKKYIKNEHNGLIVKDESAESLKKIIEFALNLTSEKISEMQNAAYKDAKKHFDFMQYTKIINDFIN